MAHQPSGVHRLHRRSDISFWLWRAAIAIWWPAHYAAQALRSEVLSRPAHRRYPSWWWSRRTLRWRLNGSRSCHDVVTGSQTTRQPTRPVGAVWNWIVSFSRAIDFYLRFYRTVPYFQQRYIIIQVTGLKWLLTACKFQLHWDVISFKQPWHEIKEEQERKCNGIVRRPRNAIRKHQIVGYLSFL